MAKYNRRAKVRKVRVWKHNVGDGGRLTQQGNNPNDKATK
jgi:hypothetical protein